MNSQIFSKLVPKSSDPNSLEITKRKFFSPHAEITKDGINKTRDFANKMSSKKQGEHREYRTGGSHFRSPKEIFINAFQGKLAEVAFYEYFKDKGLPINQPDLETYPKGQWDSFDFLINNKKINVKPSDAVYSFNTTFFSHICFCCFRVNNHCCYTACFCFVVGGLDI